MEHPITTDPEVIAKIHAQFPFTKDYALELKGTLLEEAVSLSTLEVGEFLAFLLGYEVVSEKQNSHPFAFLSPDENRELSHYRHLKVVQPWPQPEVTATTFDESGRGVITSVNKVDVVLKPIGEAQLWWGGETGVLWEATLEVEVPSETLLLNLLWERLEDYLQMQGVKSVFTYAQDPAYPGDWYKRFLLDRDYQPRSELIMVKSLDEF
jgi:hypothetical protein